jgi:predicted metal-dependent phosphoesterase TrpH
MGLTHLAITDHDTTAGVREGCRVLSESMPKLICGIELSCSGAPGKCHMLGLGIDPGNVTLCGTLERVQSARNERNELIAGRLTQLGIPCDINDVRKYASDDGVVGRPHFAQWLIANGHCNDMHHAFRAYLGDDAKAFMPVDCLTPAEGIAIIHAAGGRAYIAHPMLLRLKAHEPLEQRIKVLADAGMDGIEVFYPEHTPVQNERLARMAVKFGLTMTGGSDYHGRSRPHNVLGRMTDTGQPPIDQLDPWLLEMAISPVR